ncbi:MAG TPA: hypothetical protein H9804_04835 [Candidatus Mucispirillum faecigallinarum]|uniref:CD-NTase-associated protein 15 domain-containing protein n=1 Tax=Candidatus Mucispirillum faecigallinarum TaxID=2838699 RepID=A0A9D2GUH3_9BACT|nr:hypothetical protein [Candidatus Mucispirillum faecigallinarum]
MKKEIYKYMYVFIIIYILVDLCLKIEFNSISIVLIWDTIHNNIIQYIFLFMFFIYEKYLWKCMPFHNIPKLHKKYEGTFKSSYDNKERKMYVKINQTLFGTSVTVKTEESQSYTVAANFDITDNYKRLIYTYHNEAKAEYNERSPQHYGTTILDVEDKNELIGKYYTDRKTTGDIVLHKSTN